MEFRIFEARLGLFTPERSWTQSGHVGFEPRFSHEKLWPKDSARKTQANRRLWPSDLGCSSLATLSTGQREECVTSAAVLNGQTSTTRAPGLSASLRRTVRRFPVSIRRDAIGRGSTRARPRPPRRWCGPARGHPGRSAVGPPAARTPAGSPPWSSGSRPGDGRAA